MAGVLRKLFNLYPGEGRRTILFLILGFLWATSCFGLLTLGDGLFLLNMRSKELPMAYLITALSMASLSGLLFYAYWRHSSYLLFRLVITGSLLAQLGLIFLQINDITPPWYWFLFKTLGWMSPIAANIAFWAFMEDHFPTQDPKRCFCLFNSAIFLGDAFGGGLISFGLEALGTVGILIIFATSITLALSLLLFIGNKTKIRVISETIVPPPAAESHSLSALSKLILRSPFTLCLMLFYFVMQLLATTAEYSYMSSFDNAFSLKQQTGNLAQFLGKLAMWVSLGNMFFGFFLYSRTVSKLGVNNTLLVAPLFFSIIFFLWLGKEAFPLALCAFVAREGLLYTFDDNNFLLLITGVPAKVKNQVRTLVEALLEPVSMFFGSVLLFAATAESKTLSLILALCCLVIALLLRTHFPKALLRKLLSTQAAEEKDPEEILSALSKKEKKKIELTLLSHLRKGEESIKLTAFETLLKMEKPRISILLNAIPELSLKGKMRAIELLSESRWAKEPGILESLERWNRILPHPEIKSVLNLYITKVGDLRNEKNTLHSEKVALK